MATNQNVSNSKTGEDALVLVQESASSLALSERISNLSKAVNQVTREEAAGKFGLERQKRFLGFLQKLNWEDETAHVPDTVWDTFFEIMEKMLQSENIEDLMVPSLNILTDIFENRGDLVEQSELVESEPIRDIDMGRLLEAGHFKAYSDFVMVTNSEQISQVRVNMEKIKIQASTTQETIQSMNDKIAQLQKEVESMKAQMMSGGTVQQQAAATNQQPPATSGNAGAERQSTQALLEELKKSVAPKIATNLEDRKSESHSQQQQTDPKLSLMNEKEEAKSLKVPTAMMNSQDSAFRQGAPNVAIMSLHTRTEENNILTVQSNEQLSLKEISKNDINMNNRMSRYDQNDDDKSVFSKNYKPATGETLEELQQRIKQELADQMEQIKTDHKNRIEAKIEEIKLEHEKNIQGQINQYSNSHRDAIDTRLSEFTKEARQKLEDGEQTLQKRLSEMTVEQEQRIQSKLGEINQGQVQTYQIIMQQLAEQMEKIKADHRSRIEAKIEQIKQDSERNIQGQISQVDSSHRNVIENKLTEVAREAQKKLQSNEQTLQKMLLETNTEIEQTLQSRLREINQGQEAQIHQIRMSYGQKVNLIRESLQNKVTDARQQILAENQEVIEQSKQELIGQVHASKEMLLQQVIQAQKELDAHMKEIKDSHAEQLALIKAQHESQVNQVKLENDNHIKKLIEEKQSITDQFEAEKNRMLAAIKDENLQARETLINEKDQMMRTLSDQHQLVQQNMQSEKEEVVAKLLREKDDAISKLQTEKDEYISSLRLEQQNLVSEKERYVTSLLAEKEASITKLEAEKTQLVESLRNEKTQLVDSLQNEHQIAHRTLLNEKDEIVSRLVREKDEALSKLIIEKDELINVLKNEQQNLKTEKERLVTTLRNEHELAHQNLLTEKDRVVQNLLSEKDAAIARLQSEKEHLVSSLQNEQQNLVAEKDLYVSTLKTEHQQVQQNLMSEKDRIVQNLLAEKEQAIERLQIEKQEVLSTLINEKDIAITNLISQRDEQVQILIAEKDSVLGNIKTEKEQFVSNLIAEKNQHIQRLSLEKGKLIERLRDEHKFNENQLVNTFDNRQMKHQKSQEQQIQAMRVKYDIQIEKTNAIVEGFRKDLEVFKTNLIAAGQITPPYTLIEGNRLAQQVAKLQSDFEFFCRDTSDRQLDIQQDVGNKVSQFMTDTQGVFDSMLKDISILRQGLAQVQETHDIEQLETHLSERIATLFENSMEATAVQSETLDSLHNRVANIVTAAEEDKKRFKRDLNEQSEIFQAKFDGVHETIVNIKEQISSRNVDIDIKFGIVNDKIQDLAAKNVEYEGVKASMTLSVADKNRLDELTDFYRHLNGVVETIIDKFGTMERVTSKFMKAQPASPGLGGSSPYTPVSVARSNQPDLLQQVSQRGNSDLMQLKALPMTTPNRIAPSQIVFEDASARQVNQDMEPPSQMRPLSPNVMKKLVMTPDPNKEGKMVTSVGGAQYETMLPAVNEEFKSLEVQSLGGQSPGKQQRQSNKRSNSRPRRSVQQATNAQEDLKSKVSRMMSNHSMLVEDLKSKSGGNRQNKRRSVYSGVDNPAAVGINASIDKVSVVTLAHEIDAQGKTLEKQSAAGKPPAAGVGVGQGGRRLSANRRGESPLRSGANMQLTKDNQNNQF